MSLLPVALYHQYTNPQNPSSITQLLEVNVKKPAVIDVDSGIVMLEDVSVYKQNDPEVRWYGGGGGGGVGVWVAVACVGGGVLGILFAQPINCVKDAIMWIKQLVLLEEQNWSMLDNFAIRGFVETQTCKVCWGWWWLNKLTTCACAIACIPTPSGTCACDCVYSNHPPPTDLRKPTVQPGQTHA